MMIRRRKDLSAEVEALLSARPHNRLTLVSVESARPGLKSLHRLITLQCRCGGIRQVIWHRLQCRKYPIFACFECTALVGFENPQMPRATVSRDLAQKFIRLALEVVSEQV